MCGTTCSSFPFPCPFSPVFTFPSPSLVPSSPVLCTLPSPCSLPPPLLALPLPPFPLSLPLPPSKSSALFPFPAFAWSYRVCRDSCYIWYVGSAGEDARVPLFGDEALRLWDEERYRLFWPLREGRLNVTRTTSLQYVKDALEKIWRRSFLRLRGDLNPGLPPLEEQGAVLLVTLTLSSREIKVLRTSSPFPPQPYMHLRISALTHPFNLTLTYRRPLLIDLGFVWQEILCFESPSP